MISLLPSLYGEYYDLSQKLQKISDLISAYGGDPPTLDDSKPPQQIIPTAVAPKVNTANSIKNLPVIESYPQHGSWREKMLYGLKHLGKPVTAQELTEYVLTAEQSCNITSITNTTAQYLSKLDKEKRVDVDKTFRPYKYSLIS